MALLTAYTVTAVGINIPSASVTTQDTISATDIGTNGCYLYVINSAGSAVTVTIVDPGRTPVGNTSTGVQYSIGAGSQAWFRILLAHVDLTSQVATVQYSSATSVTYRLVRAV